MKEQEPTMNNPVEKVTIKAKIPLYKGEEAATAIELIQLVETGFEIVAQKDLYQVGDSAIYIQPDYCLPETCIFESFIRPGGDPKRCRLGSNNRIRAIKFNLHTGNGLPVYSQGILMPKKEVDSYLRTYKNGEVVDYTEALQITKWEQPEDNSGGPNVKNGSSKPFPVGMYRTDETNINNLWGRIEFPVTLIGTEKIDGSSITLYYKDGKAGICSRNLDKPLTISKVVGRRKPNIIERLKMIFGLKPDLNIYEVVESDSDFVMIGKPYLDKLKEYCEITKQNLALRGELCGQGLKGSGNKNNPHAKEKPNIKFYGLDTFGNVTEKTPDLQFRVVTSELGFCRCKAVFMLKFESREEVENICNEYFKINMIEGIVLRTPDSKVSCKYMNLDYDSKK